MLRRLLLVLLLAVAALGLTVAPPTPTEAHHAWGTYHWARTANPFTLKLGDNVSTAWDTYLAEASADWNAATTATQAWSNSVVVRTTIVAGGTTARRCRATTGRIEVCTAAYGNNGWLGLAQIWVSGSHITAGTAKMNDSYFNTSTYSAAAWRRLVMCQEVAHTYGLAHQNEAFGTPNLGSCMDYTNDPDGGGAYGPTNEHPNQHDFDQLVAIYSHTPPDSGTTVDAAPVTGRAGAPGSPFDEEGPNDPSEFGRPFGPRDQHGRSIYFERDLGNGRRLLTHVFWVEQRLPGGHHAR